MLVWEASVYKMSFNLCPLSKFLFQGADPVESQCMNGGPVVDGMAAVTLQICSGDLSGCIPLPVTPW